MCHWMLVYKLDFTVQMIPLPFFGLYLKYHSYQYDRLVHVLFKHTAHNDSELRYTGAEKPKRGGGYV